MKKYLKNLVLSGKSTIFPLVIFGVLALGLVMFYSTMEKAKATIAQKNLANNQIQEQSLGFIQENSLVAISNPSDPEPKVVKKVLMTVTAYSSSVWQTDDTPFITANGTQVKDGIVANNFLAFGTKVRIPELYGNKIFVVEDRMHQRVGNYHIDIWFPTYEEALNFGAKNAHIEILEG